MRPWADLGPLFCRENPCYRCFRSVHKCEGEDAPPEKDSWAGSYSHLCASIVAMEIIFFLSGIAPLTTGRFFRRYGLREWDSELLSWPRVPGCPRCRPFSLDSESELIDTAVVFEDYVELPSLRLAAALKSGNRYIFPQRPRTTEIKRLGNSPQIGLRASPRNEQPRHRILDGEPMGG